MRIGINCRVLASPELRGWSRYTLNIVKGLARHAEVESLHLYTDRPLHARHLDSVRSDRVRVNTAPRMNYLLWEQSWLPRQCRADGVQVLHCPINFGLPLRSPCPRVLTLHDAIGREHSLIRRVATSEWLPQIKSAFHHWAARRSAERVITVSEHARRQIVTTLRVPEQKTEVIYEAADERFRSDISVEDLARVPAKHQLTQPYIFYVGGFEERKNLPLLLNAFVDAGLSGVTLALAGSSDEQAAMLRRTLACGDQIGVRFLGRVYDDDLPALYRGATCFVYPSRDEGFGLQLCESMACGCPTLAARRTSLPEVLGDGGETFDADRPQELSALLKRVCVDSAFRENLSLRTLKRAKFFSWDRTVGSTLEAYRRCVNARQPDQSCNAQVGAA